MKVCVTTVVDGWYQEYIAPYLYCLHKAYPEYDAIIFVRDPLRKETVKALDLLDQLGYFQVVTWELDGYPHESHMTAALRWVLFTKWRIESYFAGYDYVYVTDADIFIMPESPPLAWQHMRHMNILGLPYSNVVRDYDPPCLTGCHFVSAKYLKKIESTTNTYNRRLKQRGMSIVDEAKIPDERLLYQIVRDSGIGLPPQHQSWHTDEVAMFNPANWGKTWFRPHHGVHVGIGRNPGRFKHLYRADYYREYFKQLLSYNMISDLIGTGKARVLLNQAIRGYLES